MIDNNKKKFNFLRRLNLPIDQYMVSGSGPLGIRNLREVRDIDLIVTDELWSILAEEYEITDNNGAERIIFPDGVVEAFHESSFPPMSPNENIPTISERISNAETIEGLPFEQMEVVLYYKKKSLKEKDQKDVFLIQQWLESSKNYL